MSLEKRKLYIIVPTKKITSEMLNASTSDRSSLRIDMTGKWAILKLVGTIPKCFDGYRAYDRQTILRIIRRFQWENPYIPRMIRFKRWLRSLFV